MSALLQQFDVVVVGAGVAGASAAYALAQSGARKIAVLDCGESGKGSLDGQTIDDTVHLHANRSGSAVMDNASPSRIKMIVSCLFLANVHSPTTQSTQVQVYPKSSNLFIAHHGEAGARRYLRAARRGIELEKQLAARVGADIVQRGSLYVAEADGVAGLEEEFQLLTSLGCDGIELWNRERVQEATGGARAQFERGIYFPHDAIIDSSNYASLLLQHVASNGVTLFEHCSPVRACVGFV
jgi:glycine/D-amino acid oxidase-like deaminating enzyme